MTRGGKFVDAGSEGRSKKGTEEKGK